MRHLSCIELFPSSMHWHALRYHAGIYHGVWMVLSDRNVWWKPTWCQRGRGRPQGRRRVRGRCRSRPPAGRPWWRLRPGTPAASHRGGGRRSRRPCTADALYAPHPPAHSAAPARMQHPRLLFRIMCIWIHSEHHTRHTYVHAGP